VNYRFASRWSAALCAVLAGAAFVASGFAADAPKKDVAKTSTKPVSVVKGKPAGINVGDYAPDFQLEPTEIHEAFKHWLKDKAPKTFEDKVMLSDLVGKAPIVLLFGSYT
jgi:hypothetical protein